MTIKIALAGKTPLLMHRFGDADQMAATAGTRSSISTDAQTPTELAEQSLYRDEAGVVGLPGPNVFRALIDAGTFFKVGRSKVTTQKSSILPAACSLDELFLPVTPDTWKVDTRPVRIPATGGRILRHRPCFDKWSLVFHLQLDTALIGPKLMREIVDAAGQRIGLGDFRPACKGPFGKFLVLEWKEEA